jgi:hypothetical protein
MRVDQNPTEIYKSILMNLINQHPIFRAAKQMLFHWDKGQA